MFLPIILAAAAIVTAKPVLELDYTKGTLPQNTVSAISKKFKDNFDRPKFVRDGKGYALFCGGKNQYGHFTMTDRLPFKANTPFTIVCSFKPRGGWSTPVVYYRSSWNSRDGLSIMHSGPQMHVRIGKEYIVSSDKPNPIQRNTRYFVTISWDGMVWKMTVNGREFKAVKNPAFIMPPANVKFHVGGYNILTNNVFEGTIRGVRVYNKALSLNEIHTLLVKEIKAQEQGK